METIVKFNRTRECNEKRIERKDCEWVMEDGGCLLSFNTIVIREGQKEEEIRVSAYFLVRNYVSILAKMFLKEYYTPYLTKC